MGTLVNNVLYGEVSRCAWVEDLLTKTQISLI